MDSDFKIKENVAHFKQDTFKLIADKLRPALQSLVLFPVFKHFSQSIEIEGIENLQSIEGPVVFVANHSSHADTAAILYALPGEHRRRLCIAAAADYFYKSRVVGFIVNLLMNTFPFERNNPRKGLQLAKAVLRNGQSLLIYPEGTRSISGNCITFKRGFACLSCQLGIPVVPIRVEGSREMLPKGTFWPRKARIRVAFAEPIFPKGHKSDELAHLAEESVRLLAHAA